MQRDGGPGPGGGPGGGGNPTGEFTGAAEALEIVGNHVYAYSGGVAALDSSQTVFDFTSPGSGYIVATLTMTAPIKMTTDDITNGLTRGWQLDFNSQTVGLYKADTVSEDMPSMIDAQILIPPFTAVVLTCVDDSPDATYFGTANITGRIYRG